MAETNVEFTNNTSKLLYPYGQHFWAGSPVTAPGRIPPKSTGQGKQQATTDGALKFATVFVDSEAEVDTTRKFITAFEIPAPQVFGPFGSDSPNNYSVIVGSDETIKEVIVRHGFIVDAIGLVIADKSGSTSTKVFGGTKGNQETIKLQENEFVAHISGTYGKYAHSDSSAVVATISIHTNARPNGYGPFGEGRLVTNPTNFSTERSFTPVVGFFGRNSNYLESIGVYRNRHGAVSKAYAESGPFGPIDWNVVEVKLGLSQSSVVYEDNILGSKVEATVEPNNDATVVISDN